jgi:hypothetical protein
VALVEQPSWRAAPPAPAATEPATDETKEEDSHPQP